MGPAKDAPAKNLTDNLLLCWSILGWGSIFSFISLEHFLLLQGLSFFSPLPGLLHPGAASLSLVGQHLGPGLLSLLLVDELHEDPLVLEHISLSFEVQLMVQVAIDLLCFPVSFQESSEDPHPGDPHTLLASSCIFCTLPLTKATVTSLAAGLIPM